MRHSFLDARPAKARRRDRALPSTTPDETAAPKPALAPVRRLARMRALLLQAAFVAVLCVAPPVARAADMPPVRQDAVLTGDAIQGAMTETIYLDGDRARIDFEAGPKLRGRWLSDGRHSWLQREPSRAWLPADGFRIGRVVRLDPQRPCWQADLSCAPADGRTVAGRPAKGWRYRHAGQEGPMGTDSGEFWLDAETGLLLAFRGRDLGGHDYRMETVALAFGPLDPSLFERERAGEPAVSR